MRMHATGWWFACLLMAHDASAWTSDCAVQSRKRELRGPHPLTAQLRLVAMNEANVFFAPGEFHRETFAHLGKVGHRSGHHWHVVRLETIWGSSCRLTSRLLVFDSNRRYLGNFSHIPSSKITIRGDTLMFSEVDPESGALLRFTNDGPPSKAWIDGEVHSFER